MRKQATEAMAADDVDCLINAARGMDIPIFEYIYQIGLIEGIRMSDLIEQMRQG